MFGCERAGAARAWRSNRTGSPPADRILTATGRSSSSSRALQTSAIAPRPSRRSRRYRPATSRSGTLGHYPEPAVRHAAYLARVRVVGIDPGTAACGYAVVEEERGRLHGLEH